MVGLTSRFTWTSDTKDKFTMCTSFNVVDPLDDGHSGRHQLRNYCYHKM